MMPRMKIILNLLKFGIPLSKIKKSTDEEHELIIENEKNSKVGGSEHIELGKNTEFEFKTMNADELNYCCEYHPETMRGIIKVIESTQ
ncbi:MAG TPA: hypothetical protein VFR61_05565 [Nitrososphaeraceae archaeon]|jgi:plastocyanin|nr:hypothetical protein [Nitrososphaeraceae archaeon]